MATARTIIRDAFTELGIYQPGETPSAPDLNLGLQRFQNQLDAWAADRLTLSLQLSTAFTMPSGTSSITLGPVAADVIMPMPVWVNTLNYVNPGSSPAQEVAIGMMNEDAFAALSIKALPSALPQQAFYQTNLTGGVGTLFVWPQVSQDVTLVLYAPQAVTIPSTLDTIVSGPPGYAEAFFYQLALRLANPFGVDVTPQLQNMAARAFATMKRVNVDPGILAVDAALVPSMGAGYNVLSDQTTAWGGR